MHSPCIPRQHLCPEHRPIKMQEQPASSLLWPFPARLSPSRCSGARSSASKHRPNCNQPSSRPKWRLLPRPVPPERKSPVRGAFAASKDAPPRSGGIPQQLFCPKLVHLAQTEDSVAAGSREARPIRKTRARRSVQCFQTSPQLQPTVIPTEVAAPSSSRSPGRAATQRTDPSASVSLRTPVDRAATAPLRSNPSTAD
jgi:hypothetical protein